MSLFLSPEVDRTIRYAVEFARPREVMGWGKVSAAGGHLYITDVMIPPQKVGNAHVEVDGEVYVKVATELATKTPPEFLSQWNFWWHSHVDMGTTPSSQDNETLREFAKDCGYAVGMVVNFKREKHGWFEMVEPFQVHGTIDIVVGEPEDAALREAVAETIKKMVKDQPPHYRTPGAGWSGGSPTRYSPTLGGGVTYYRNGQPTYPSSQGGGTRNDVSQGAYIRTASGRWRPQFGYRFYSPGLKEWIEPSNSVYRKVFEEEFEVDVIDEPLSNNVRVVDRIVVASTQSDGVQRDPRYDRGAPRSEPEKEVVTRRKSKKQQSETPPLLGEEDLLSLVGGEMSGLSFYV